MEASESDSQIYMWMCEREIERERQIELYLSELKENLRHRSYWGSMHQVSPGLQLKSFSVCVCVWGRERDSMCVYVCCELLCECG